MTHKLSKKLLNILAPILVVIALASTYRIIITDKATNKAELAYLEHSPSGSKGGSVMPASCDSYPWHSTCECNPSTDAPETYDNPPTSTSCGFTNGVGRLVRHCQGGESWTWVKDSCTLISCNPGFDLVTDSAGTRCAPSCTGNQYRTYTTDTRQTGCSCYVGQQCSLLMKEDEKDFSEYLGISKAFALGACLDPIFSTVTTAGCSDCPNGQVPNANHTSCVAVATPSVNINIGH